MKKINLFLIGLMVLISLVALPRLPAMVPIHWNWLGQADNWTSKLFAALMWPILTTVMWIGFQLLPKFDPKKEKYVLFKPEWEIIQTGIIGFFSYLQIITFYVAINPTAAMMPLMFIGLGALFILMGNYLSKIRQNYFIGIRLPWTLANEENWNLTHRYASWCFVITGIVILIEAYAIWYAPMVIFASLMMAIILPSVYSFLLFKNQASKMKLVYLALVLMVGTIFFLRVASGEDEWICQNGQWIKHGQPSLPQPTEPCLK